MKREGAENVAIDRISELERELADVSGKLEQAQKEISRLSAVDHQLELAQEGLMVRSRLEALESMFCENHGETTLSDANVNDPCPLCKSESELAALRLRLEQVKKLQELTLQNEIRWMQKAEASESRQRVLEQALREIADKDPNDPDVESWKWLARKFKELAESALAQGEPARTPGETKEG